MKKILVIITFLLLSSCIPLRIAPNVKDSKVMVARKFKRDLPRYYSFVFKDTKDANEFYSFINMKYDLKEKDVGWNVPLFIDNKEYFLSYYESEIPTKTINLIPIIVDAKLESNGNTPLLEDMYYSRIGNWYLVLTVFDSDMEDCLRPEYESREKVIKYLKELKSEYLNTHNYVQSLWKKKQSN